MYDRKVPVCYINDFNHFELLKIIHEATVAYNSKS